MKKVLLGLSLLTLVGAGIFPLSGCGQPVTSGQPLTGAGATPTATVSTKPDLPLLDKETHGPLETAYFALG